MWAQLLVKADLENNVFNPKKTLKQIDELEKIVLNELGLKNSCHIIEDYVDWFIEIEDSITDEIINEFCNKLRSILEKYFRLEKEIKIMDIRLYVKEQIPENSKITGNLITLISLNFNNKVSLHNIHKQINCPNATVVIISLSYIISNVLGLVLLKVKKLNSPTTYVESEKWVEIVVNHFNSGKDVLECQEELIEKGYKEYAKL